MDYKRAYGYEKSIYEYYVVGVVAFHGDDVVNGSCYGRLTGSQENVYLYTLFEKKGTMKTAIKLVLVYFVISRGNHESAAAEAQSGKGYYIVGAYLRDFSY